MKKNNLGQGTIEYLVIIAIVVVISLVVVYLIIGNVDSASSTSQTSSTIFNKIGSGGISVIEAISDYDGTAVISLSNFSGEARHLNKIVTDEAENEYDDVFISGDELIDIKDLCTCEEGMKSKTCNFKFYFKEVLESVNLQVSVKCENNFEPNEPPAEPIQPFTFKIITTLPNQDYKFQIDDATEMKIDWNLGNGWENLTNGSSLRTKNYSTAGTYYIKLKGQASRIAFGSDETTPSLLDDIITPLGNSITGLTSAREMFAGTSITQFTSQNFFDSVSKNITDMSFMFEYSSFNGDISNWNVSSVNTMGNMFAYSSFDEDISNWNVSSVNDMGFMFYDSSFNGDISNWDVSSVINMPYMFFGSSFNGDISNWNVSSVTNMDNMFFYSSFNGDISNWNVSSVNDMSNMFGSSSFNQDISNWDVSSVINMGSMFYDSSFDGNILNWNVSSVTSMWNMFGYSSFNQDISNWDVSSVNDMGNMFVGSSFNQNISSWDVTNVTSCSDFNTSSPLQPEYIPNFTNCTP